ncbi:hypothetical protein DNI29_15070 [Hymenobacter sediminis]|uniref:M949_RS01915 family surface polysaccharide biosynthesis protein n=1 Tax=Hymenobacter sediminis TaxID=2218621 RepID=UPI000F4E20A0|nr:hypothetical protein [Hymenobacter sediminis]RPD46320.1 hypothetical protein DNI29_15070 [Hymenobacter sediminis]
MRKFSLGFALLLGVGACSDNPPQTSAASTAPAAQSAAPTTPNSIHVRTLKASQILDPTLLPPGKLLEARQWQDRNGENLLVITRRGPFDEKITEYTDEESGVELFARQYVRQAAGRWQELWHMQDAIRNCAFDMWLGPLPGSTSVTDLNADGETETTLVYQLTCRSDVSPSDLKLIMHAGRKKYALRGQTVVQYDSVTVAQRAPANPCCVDTLSKAELDAPEGYTLYAGRYQNEKDFRGAPPELLRYARQQWRKWSLEDHGEQL